VTRSPAAAPRRTLLIVERLGDKLLNWASILDHETRRQAERTASLPIVHPHVALMPDAHLGKGATVGSVLPTREAIIPAAVGVDIGCGMIAVRTPWSVDEVRQRGPLAPLRGDIERAVPLSAGRYNKRLTPTAEKRVEELRELAGSLGVLQSVDATSPNWPLQLGSLGSGNHFIEVTADERHRVWLFLHSGSRGVGNRIASNHIVVAQKRAERDRLDLPERDLAWLDEGTREFDRYMAELQWAQHFALLNREEMMDRVADSLARHMRVESTPRLESVNCLAGETKVMTRTGSRPIEALAGGEHELLTSGGVWVKAPVRSFGRQEVSEIVLSRSGVTKTIRATANHRWLLRSRRGREYAATTKELFPGDRLQFVFPERPSNMGPVSESVARGFVFGDTARESRATAYFCGAKDLAMMRYFEDLGRPPRTYGDVTVINGLPLEWKTQPMPLDSPTEELYGWLAGYFAADGDVDKSGRPTLAAAFREHLEYVRVACQSIGIGTFGIRSRLRRGYGKELTPLHMVGLMRGDLGPDFFLLSHHRSRFEAGRKAAERRGWNVISVHPTTETVEVFCATVEGTHSFALEDNILTGNCHHNFTSRETHDGVELWVSRKGAIQAKRGQDGLIPGSMGTASYVVSGLGNPLSLESSPHGAGRAYSRSKARKTFTRAELEKSMAGIEWRHSDAFLDEIPAAYKPVDVVMEDAKDLVEIRHTLRQLVNVKGD
jgi:RNA-splicing ligase RtcB